VYLTRHAKNRARRWDLPVAAIETLLHPENAISPDRRGNPRFAGKLLDKRYVVVVALDNPDLIITIIHRGR
jgi:hypothetical protein